MAVSPRASGQFIRLAGFDFSAKTGVDAVYTTNVEQERKSEATADREDYYLVWWLGLDAIREIGPSTKLDLSTGMAIEKHFNRPDLDNSDRPFARGRIRIDSQLNRYLLFASASYERTSESTENVFVPGGGKRRQVGTTIEYLGGFDWEYNDWSAGASYTLTQDRYDSEDFKPDEQDEDKILAYIYWKMFENLGLGYKYEREKVDFINRDDGEGDWLTTQTITLDWLITLIQRPHLTYSLGIEKEDTDEEDGEWELTHTFMVTDEWDLSPTLRLSGFASYKIEETPEEDEVELQYGIFLDHVLSQRSSQSLYATRKPVKTLGSTLDTAETVYGYLFKTIDFLIYDLSFNFSVKYTINEPVVGDTEKLWEYMASLEHRRQLTPNLSRTLRYTYTLEESNLESENLDEHEVRLSFEYVF
ncbi:MAG TPA: hypothetical protein PJ991_12570 [Kiritimatiellia bacterium]|nr:hypothetical protein [Kiritimatiellia bacterium]